MVAPSKQTVSGHRFRPGIRRFGFLAIPGRRPQAKRIVEFSVTILLPFLQAIHHPLFLSPAETPLIVS